MPFWNSKIWFETRPSFRKLTTLLVECSLLVERVSGSNSSYYLCLLYLANKLGNDNYNDKGNRKTWVTRNEKSGKQPNNQSGSRKKVIKRAKEGGFQNFNEAVLQKHLTRENQKKRLHLDCCNEPKICIIIRTQVYLPLLHCWYQRLQHLKQHPTNYRNLSRGMSTPDITTRSTREEVKNNICHHCSKLRHLNEDGWWVQ